MQGVHKARYHFRIPGVLAVIFAQLAGVVVEGPGFGYLGGHQLYHDVQGVYPVKIVGEMRANAE